MAAVPAKSIRVSTWADSSKGHMNSDSRKAMLDGRSPIHRAHDSSTPRVYARAMRIAVVAALLAAGVATIARAQTLPAPSTPTPAAPAAPAAVSPAPALRTVATMSELMVHMIRPTSDAVFYITSRTPQTPEAWEALQSQTLALSEAGTLLMLPTHVRGRAQWLADARLMRDAGRKAFEAAKKKDAAALEALNDELYQSCTTCHEHFRPGYGKRPPAGGARR